MYITKTVSSGSKWLIEEPCAFQELTIEEGVEISAPEGKELTLIVNGVGTPLEPGKYIGDVRITLSETYGIPPCGMHKMRGNPPEPTRAAICIVNGKLDEDKSVLDMAEGGAVDAGHIKDVRIRSNEDDFVGIAIDGRSPSTISNWSSRAMAPTTSSAAEPASSRTAPVRSRSTTRAYTCAASPAARCRPAVTRPSPSTSPICSTSALRRTP